MNFHSSTYEIKTSTLYWTSCGFVATKSIFTTLAFPSSVSFFYFRMMNLIFHRIHLFQSHPMFFLSFICNTLLKSITIDINNWLNRHCGKKLERCSVAASVGKKYAKESELYIKSIGKMFTFLRSSSKISLSEILRSWNIQNTCFCVPIFFYRKLSFSEEFIAVLHRVWDRAYRSVLFFFHLWFISVNP